MTRPGPLSGIRLVEIAGIGPVAFTAMWCADMGADVIRVERPGDSPSQGTKGLPGLNRGRPSLTLDLKDQDAVETVLQLCEAADGLIEGFRPGVMERLGLGPTTVRERNPKLVYGRLTGYGQEGPLANAAGHDINFLAQAGVLGAMKRVGERPMFPLTLVGDIGGGAMLLAMGLLAALIQARSSGQGQVVDAAMVDGAALMSVIMHDLRGTGAWEDKPGTNMLDSGAHFYEVYETADNRFLAVGAVEPQFYAELLRGLEISAEAAPQWQRGRWPELKQLFAETIAGCSREEWEDVFAGLDACVTPVLHPGEAAGHPTAVARQGFAVHDGATQPSPAPRFSSTPGSMSSASSVGEVLERWGVEIEVSTAAD
jgi:alpha-methylacyl-CoA racemase